MPVDQISRPGRCRVTNRGPPPAATANPLQSLIFHQPLDGAPRHRNPFTVERQPHLPGPVDAVVLGVDTGDHRRQLGVAECPLRSRPGRRLVVSGRGDPAAVFSQYGADRLDTPDQTIADATGPVFADEPHQRLCGRSVKVGLRRGAGRDVRSVSSGRFPNPACTFQCTGLSTSPVVRVADVDVVVGQGVGMIEPR